MAVEGRNMDGRLSSQHGNFELSKLALHHHTVDVGRDDDDEPQCFQRDAELACFARALAHSRLRP